MANKKQKSTTAKKPVQKLKPWHYLLLVVIPLVIYGRTIFFEYVMHDDDKMILENPRVKEGVSPAIAFTTDAWFMDADTPTARQRRRTASCGFATRFEFSWPGIATLDIRKADRGHRSLE